MQFPTNVSFRVTDKAEYDELARALQGWVVYLQSQDRDAAPLATILERARYHDDKGLIQEAPEAYVETGARRVGAGDLPDMQSLFQQEIAGHRAKVVLYKREGLSYRPIQTRQGVGR